MSAASSAAKNSRQGCGISRDLRQMVRREIAQEIPPACVIRAVDAELGVRGRRWPGHDEVARAVWIKQVVVRDRNLIALLLRDLDRGEAETLALPLEIGAELVLMDERDGRRVAQCLGLRAVGVLGVLLEAKKRGLLTGIRPLLDALRHDAGFYVSDAVYQSVLDLAGESVGNN